MKNPSRKKQGFRTAKDFQKILASALKKRYFENSKINVWIEGFVGEVRPLLEELYCKYGIRPDSVFVWSAICKFSPVPQAFPKELRNRRQRERLAAVIEKAAAALYILQLLNIYGINVVSVPTINIPVRSAAARVRKLKSVPGRPQNRFIKDYATYLAKLFRSRSVSPANSYIARLLKATFQEGWLAHGDDIDAVKKLVRGTPTTDIFKQTFEDVRRAEIRMLVRKHEKNFDRPGMKATPYEHRLNALLKTLIDTNKRTNRLDGIISFPT